MEDFSNELNKPSIQKFKRQKVIVNHKNEIHSTDLVDMTQYYKFTKVINISLLILTFLVNMLMLFR